MITSLTLKNWRTHKESTLEFGKGTNVIVGVMGSGKSSIVNAISYSLFGTFPSLKNKSVTLKEIIMNKPNQENNAETKLLFEIEEKKFRVERIIKLDGTNEAKLYEGTRLIAGPKQKDVNEKVEKILGLNYELFSRAVYAEQNELDFFLKLSPSERKKKFDELLELEKYEEARKNSISLQNELLKRNKQSKEFIEQQKETIKSHEEEKLEKMLQEEEKIILELEKEIAATKNEIQLVEKEFNELAEKEKQSKILEELVVKMKSRIETIKEDAAKSEKLSFKEIAAEIEKTLKEITQLNEKIRLKEEESKTLDTEIKKSGEELSVIQYKEKKFTQEEKEINSLKGECPTCKRELDEKHKKEIIAKITEKKEKIKEEEKILAEKNKKLGEKLGNIKKENEIMKKENDEKKRNLYKLEAVQKQAFEFENKKKQLIMLEEELPKIKKQLEEMGFDKKKLDLVREQIYKKKSVISVAETKIKSKQELKKSYENTLQKILQIKKNMNEMEKEILKTEEAAKKIGVFANCLIATQIELRESMLETTNQAMTSIWQTIYPYKDFTDAKLCVVEEGYDLQVKTRNNGWVRVEGVLSGGERSAAALCIRIAFALVLTKRLSMLILDEPTHNLDTNAVSKLSEMLREELPKIVEQIFVITHDKQLENAASSNLYLLARNKDEDGATQSENISAY